MYKLLTLVLNPKQGQRCVSLAKSSHISKGFVLLGKGFVFSKFLNALGIKHKNREVLTYLVKSDEEEKVLDFFTRELQLNLSGHGFAFTTYAMEVGESMKDKINKERAMFNKLTVIVDRGKAEQVMDVARKAGAKGGTILHGRGTGAEFTEKLLGMEIEPEKELVMILLPENLVDNVTRALHDQLNLDQPGMGILFIEPVSNVRGLV